MDSVLTNSIVLTRPKPTRDPPTLTRSSVMLSGRCGLGGGAGNTLDRRLPEGPFMDGLRILVTSSGVHRACRMTVVGCSCVSQLPLAAGACSSCPYHSTYVSEAAASGRRLLPYGLGNASTLACHRRSVVCGRTQPSLRRPSLALRALSTRQPHPSHARSRINRAVDAQALEVLVTSPLRVRAEHPKRPWCASPPIRVLVTAP